MGQLKHNVESSRRKDSATVSPDKIARASSVSCAENELSEARHCAEDTNET
jgi:hypothetical protein